MHISLTFSHNFISFFSPHIPYITYGNVCALCGQKVFKKVFPAPVYVLFLSKRNAISFDQRRLGKYSLTLLFKATIFQRPQQRGHLFVASSPFEIKAVQIAVPFLYMASLVLPRTSIDPDDQVYNCRQRPALEWRVNETKLNAYS